MAGDAVVVEAGLERELEMWREQGFLGLKAKGRVNLEMGDGYMEEGLRMGVVEVEVAAAAAAILKRKQHFVSLQMIWLTGNIDAILL